MIRSIWTFPNTALGWILAYVGGASFHSKREGARFYVAPSKGPWARFFARGFLAITFGEIVVFEDEEAVERLILVAHELRHVEQYRRLGPFFIPAYLFCSLLAVVMGRKAHEDNWLEIDARWG